MAITIALAGNPNSGKSTLFNALTGANQYVGNWPGVTVEKKEGSYRENPEISITDLPGVYSLSPYTLEEIVSRDYLVNEKPDVIIDVVDASNIERNLYLATQLSELGIPMIIALNMMDVVERHGDKIDTKELSAQLGCEVVEISALKHRGIDELMQKAAEVAQSSSAKPIASFDNKLESCLKEIVASVAALQGNQFERWYAIKLLEHDEKALSSLSISAEEKQKVESLVDALESELDDDGEGIITDARYSFITSVVSKTVKKGQKGLLSFSDKIDKIVTNRILALPIFALLMFGIYYLAVQVVGGPITDWVNDILIGSLIQENVRGLLEAAAVSPWLVGLICDGIIAGVGAPLGFLPQIVTIFILLAILEDVGYMSRIAFILDRIFRKFGLSGKSFIPILIGTGCAVPGIMATRTIENESDRKMTIMVAHFMPCGAKTVIITLLAASILNYWWFGPLMYFAGIAAVVVSGVILKKFAAFAGDPTPFVMELPQYHLPTIGNVARVTWDRTKGFVVKAGTVIMLVVIVLWFLQNISVNFQFHEFGPETDSLLAAFGKIFAPLLSPLGFGDWIATVATFAGIAAKEVVVSTMGVLAGLGDVSETDPSALALAASLFTPVSGFAFMIFNQLNTPCQACIGTYRSELKSGKWIAAVVGYQLIFSYAVAFMIYQFGIVLFEGAAFSAWTAAALVVLAISIFLLVRKPSKAAQEKAKLSNRAVDAHEA